MSLKQLRIYIFFVNCRYVVVVVSAFVCCVFIMCGPWCVVCMSSLYPTAACSTVPGPWCVVCMSSLCPTAACSTGSREQNELAFVFGVFMPRTDTAWCPQFETVSFQVMQTCTTAEAHDSAECFSSSTASIPQPRMKQPRLHQETLCDSANSMHASGMQPSR